MPAQTIQFPNQHQAKLAYANGYGDLPDLFRVLGLDAPRPVIVLIAGAAGVEPEHREVIEQGAESLARVAEQLGAAVMDGGTEAGGMAAMGAAYARGSYGFPLIGIAARGTVYLPGQARGENQCNLDPNHTHFILTPGAEWGDEVPWIAEVAGELAGPCPSVTVLANGGEIARRDVAASRSAGRSVLVLEGSGRLADELASDPPLDDLVTIVSGSNRVLLAAELHRVLGNQP